MNMFLDRIFNNIKHKHVHGCRSEFFISFMIDKLVCIFGTAKVTLPYG